MPRLASSGAAAGGPDNADRDRTAAALALACLVGANGAAARTLLTETIGSDVLSVDRDDVTQDGSLLINGQPVVLNRQAPVGVDGIFATPSRIYILADVSQTPGCYRYEVVALDGGQVTASPPFGDCGYAYGRLVKGVLKVSLRPTGLTAPIKPTARYSFDR